MKQRTAQGRFTGRRISAGGLADRTGYDRDSDPHSAPRRVPEPEPTPRCCVCGTETMGTLARRGSPTLPLCERQSCWYRIPPPEMSNLTMFDEPPYAPPRERYQPNASGVVTGHDIFHRYDVEEN